MEKLRVELQVVEQARSDGARDLDDYKNKLDEAKQEHEKALENARST